MSVTIQETLELLYKTMLEMYPLNFEEFKTRIAEQDENFQGVALILTEGLYAFEEPRFEQQLTQETTNDNQETTVSENDTPTSSY